MLFLLNRGDESTSLSGWGGGGRGLTVTVAWRLMRSSQLTCADCEDTVSGHQPQSHLPSRVTDHGEGMELWVGRQSLAFLELKAAHGA